MNFSDPQYLAWLLPVAGLAAFLFRREQRDQRKMERFLSSSMLGRLRRGDNTRARILGLSLRTLGVVMLVVALAGPRWGKERVPLEHEASDVIFAVDCSRSMQADDLKPSRMEVSRRELRRLMTRLEGQRLGLVGFAGAAYVLSPLTLDVGATQLFLEQLSANTIPIQGTSLAEAIYTSLSMFPEGDHSRAIVLLTDGEDHTGAALQAAQEAAQQGVVIHTVGVGSEQAVPIPDPVEGTVRDRNGQVVLSQLNETALREIAQATGGTYHRVNGNAEPVGGLSQGILGQEGRQLLTGYEDQPIPRFQLFLGLGLTLLALSQALCGREETV